MTSLVSALGDPASGRVGGSLIVGCALALLVACVLSLSIGATGTSLWALPEAFAAALGLTDEQEAHRQSLVLLGIRLPRTLLGALVGAGLAVSGVLMQGLFRNPLADPGLIGVSAGAALAAVATIALGGTALLGWTRVLGIYALPISAFLGGLVTTFGLLAVASRNGQLATGTLLLTGIAVGALAGALTGLIAYASDERELRDLTLWSMGSLSGASWPKVAAALPFAVAVALVLPRLVRALNGLLLGEAEAFHLGIDVEAAKRAIVGVTAAAVGAAVAVAGVIGFVGLVTPHLVRLIAGPDHRIVLPASAMLGATLVVGADILARMLVRPAEMPIGIVLAAIGAPIFLHLVLQRGAGGTE